MRTVMEGMATYNLEFCGRLITTADVDAFLPELERQLSMTEPGIPIVLHMLDNSCFKSVNRDGDLLSIGRNKADKSTILWETWQVFPSLFSPTP